MVPKSLSKCKAVDVNEKGQKHKAQQICKALLDRNKRSKAKPKIQSSYYAKQCFLCKAVITN